MKVPIVSFKTKIRQIENADGSKSDYVEYKRQVARTDCNLRPHEHTYYNSDLFLPMLNAAYKKVIQNKAWVKLSDLPPEVNIDKSDFLAEVTVKLPEDFR